MRLTCITFIIVLLCLLSADQSYANEVSLVRLKGGERDSVGRILEKSPTFVKVEFMGNPQKLTMTLDSNQIEHLIELNSIAIQAEVEECKVALKAKCWDLLAEKLLLLNVCRGCMDLSTWQETIDSVRKSAISLIMDEYQDRLTNSGTYERKILDLAIVRVLHTYAMTGFNIDNAPQEIKDKINTFLDDIYPKIDEEEYLRLYSAFYPASDEAFSYASFYMERGDYNKALPTLVRYVEFKKSAPDAWGRIATCQVNIGDWDSALRTVKEKTESNNISKDQALFVLREFVKQGTWPYGFSISPNELFDILRHYDPKVSIRTLYQIQIRYRWKDADAHYGLAVENEKDKELLAAANEYRTAGSLRGGPPDASRRAMVIYMFYEVESMEEAVRDRRDYYAEIVEKAKLADYTVTKTYYSWALDEYVTISYYPIIYYMEPRDEKRANILSKALSLNPYLEIRSDIDDKQLDQLKNYKLGLEESYRIAR